MYVCKSEMYWGNTLKISSKDRNSSKLLENVGNTSWAYMLFVFLTVEGRPFVNQ